MVTEPGIPTFQSEACETTCPYEKAVPLSTVGIQESINRCIHFPQDQQLEQIPLPSQNLSKPSIDAVIKQCPLNKMNI